MAWQTPKTDWRAADSVRDSDFNRIEENIRVLYDQSSSDNKTVYVSGASGSDETGNGSSGLPYKTIAKALSALPRNIGNHAVTLNIASSTYLVDVVIKGFTGTLILNLSGIASIRSITIDGCNVIHTGAQLNCPQGMTLRNNATFYTNTNMSMTSAVVGLAVESGSVFNAYSTVSISNASSAAIDVSGGGHVYIANISGTGNLTGLRAASGGTITYSGLSLTATTRTTTNTGGRIYSGAQTSIPNY